MSSAPSTHPGSVHTYRGRTVEELLPKIQDELGASAIIVRRREGLTGGIAGFFQRRFVELEATEGAPQIDLYDEDPGTSETRSFPPQREPSLHPGAAAQAQALSPLNAAYVSERLAALARAGPLEPARPPALPRAVPRHLAQAETGVADPFALILERASTREQDPTSPNPSRGKATAASPSRAQTKVRQGLLALGVSEQFADELIEGAAAHIRPFAPRASVAQAVRSALAARIPVAPPLPAQGAAIVLVGPGGAGKTSCCAALLGAYRRASALPASCATLIADQPPGELRMLLSPYVMKPTSIETTRAMRALRKTKSEGLLAIDTPPLSPHDRAAIRKLATTLAELGPERTVVVLPTTFSAAAAAQLLQALTPLKANALALTHSEDTDQLGMAVEAACKFGLAPEYMLSRARPRGWSVGRLDPAGLAASLVQ
jgi:flagellar biosynthesis protein FlhF